MKSRLPGNQQDRCGAPGARVGVPKTGRFQFFSSRQERCRGEHSPDFGKPEQSCARPGMAVTRGSAKRSSCCPSTGNQAPGASSSAAGASNVSSNPGGAAADDNAGAMHQRSGAGHRQSKRPALVDRTNDGTAAGPSNATGVICPGEAQAPEAAPEAATSSVAELGNADSRQGLPSHGVVGLLASAQISVSGTAAGAQGPPGLSLATESGSAGLASQSTTSVHPSAAGLGLAAGGLLGNAANSRASSKRSGTSIRGRVKGRGPAPASMAGTRRQRSESGDLLTMDSADEEEAPQLATGLSDASLDRAMDCDRQAGVDEADAAEQRMEDTDTEGQQLLSTETLLCCGESDALGGGPAEAHEVAGAGLLAATSTSLSDPQAWERPCGMSDRGAGKGSAEGKVEAGEAGAAKGDQRLDGSLERNACGGSDTAAPAQAGVPETCCKSYFGAPGGTSFGSSASCSHAAINCLLATNEDLGPPSAQAVRNPVLSSSADLSVEPGNGSDNSFNGHEMGIGSSAGHWGIGSQGAVASGPALFGSFPAMGTTFAPGSTVSVRASAPGLLTGGSDASGALQERLQGSAVQAADSAMASLQRHAERSWQISSIRPNRAGGMPIGDADWLSKVQEQPLSRQLDRDCATASAPAAPTLLGAPSATEFGAAPCDMSAGNPHLFRPVEQQQMPAFQQLTQDQAPMVHPQALKPVHTQPQPSAAPHASLNPMEVNQGAPGAPQAHHLHHQQQQHTQQHQQQQQQLMGQLAAPSASMQQEQLQHQQGLAHLGQFLSGSGAPGVRSSLEGGTSQPQAGERRGPATEPGLALSRPAPMGMDGGAGSGLGGGVSSSWGGGSGGMAGMGGSMAAMQGCLKGLASHMDIDGNHSDPQLCATYAADIFQHLRNAEAQRRPTMGYMDTVQSDINEQMRGILIDWLVEVAEEYKLVADTLYLTCSFIDRYLSTTMVARGRLQLLGVSCMLIASKYEEIYAPQVDEFCYITDNTYRKEEVIEMERTVLKELEFELSYPTVKSFLRRFIRAAQADLPEPSIELELLGNFFAELTLVDYGSLKFPPSVIAASAVFLAKRTLWPDTHPWTSTLQHYSSYSPSYLRECILNLHDLHCNKKRCTLPAIREKYRQAKFKHVASIAPCPELPEELFLGPVTPGT